MPTAFDRGGTGPGAGTIAMLGGSTWLASFWPPTEELKPGDMYVPETDDRGVVIGVSSPGPLTAMFGPKAYNALPSRETVAEWGTNTEQQRMRVRSAVMSGAGKAYGAMPSVADWGAGAGKAYGVMPSVADWSAGVGKAYNASSYGAEKAYDWSSYGVGKAYNASSYGAEKAYDWSSYGVGKAYNASSYGAGKVYDWATTPPPAPPPPPPAPPRPPALPPPTTTNRTGGWPFADTQVTSVKTTLRTRPPFVDAPLMNADKTPTEDHNVAPGARPRRVVPPIPIPTPPVPPRPPPAEPVRQVDVTPLPPKAPVTVAPAAPPQPPPGGSATPDNCTRNALLVGLGVLALNVL